MINLFLIRHADAELNSSTGKDFDRNLSNLGRSQCVELRKKLKEFDFDTVHFFVSSSQRTSQTFKFLFADSKVQYVPELYLASSSEILRFINTLKSNNPICIIAHNEGISELASYLTGQRILMNTANFIELKFDYKTPEYISSETAHIVQFIS
jgi:phosphohistidine phosphatase